MPRSSSMRKIGVKRAIVDHHHATVGITLLHADVLPYFHSDGAGIERRRSAGALRPAPSLVDRLPAASKVVANATRSG